MEFTEPYVLWVVMNSQENTGCCRKKMCDVNGNKLHLSDTWPGQSNRS